MGSTDQTFAVPLYEGTFSVGIDKQFKEIDNKESPEKGALKISINPFLIKTGKRNYLFDAGLGDFGEGTGTETIINNLNANGLTEYQITDIFCSHLHYDHIGGLAGRRNGYWELTFPQAKIWVSRGGWSKVISLDQYYDDEKTEFIHFLDAKADLHYYEDEPPPCDEITVSKIGGHTEFSQLLLFDNGIKKYMMAGDVLATRGAVNRKYAAKYDYDPEQSMKVRSELVQKACEEQFTIMGYHDSHHPLFKLTDYDERRGYTIQNVGEHVPT